MWAELEGFGWLRARQGATIKGKVEWGRFRANKQTSIVLYLSIAVQI
jgi:hypothetical protein